MTELFEHIIIFVLLLTGFMGLFYLIESTGFIEEGIINAKKNMDAHDRRFRSEKRKLLAESEERNTFLSGIERQLQYSGLMHRFRWVTISGFIVFNAMTLVTVFIIAVAVKGFVAGIISTVAVIAVEYMIISVLKAQRLNSVNEELPKLLDFLGNYSLTSGDITSVFSQISRYLKEPLRGVLEECEAESKVGGDSKTAIISMADKIEHPQFKQLARNLEIASRYSADLGSVVRDSRRSLREYMSQGRDRKNLLRESGINMFLLVLMSVAVLAIVNMLIEGGIFGILFGSIPGHLALAGMAIIVFLYFIQAATMGK